MALARRTTVATLDLLGPGFTLLTGVDYDRWQRAASRASTTLDIPLAVHAIAETEWARATGLAPDGALLIRPDDFVGWHADALAADPDTELQRVLSAILARS